MSIAYWGVALFVVFPTSLLRFHAAPLPSK